MITVSEAGQAGTSRKVPAQDLSNFLNTQVGVECVGLFTLFNFHGQAANLKTMGVEAVIPKLSFSKADISQYLAEPPCGG